MNGSPKDLYGSVDDCRLILFYEENNVDTILKRCHDYQTSGKQLCRKWYCIGKETLKDCIHSLKIIGDHGNCIFLLISVSSERDCSKDRKTSSITTESAKDPEGPSRKSPLFELGPGQAACGQQLSGNWGGWGVNTACMVKNSMIIENQNDILAKVN